MHKLMTFTLAGALAGCTLIGGDDAPATETGELHSLATSGSKIFAMHDPGGEYLMPNGGWVVYNDYLDSGPLAINTNYGALMRINASGAGTLPCAANYQIPAGKGWHDTPYGTAVYNFVSNSTNANGHIWIIGNETNHPVEWPTCNGAAEPITPANYARAFRVARDAIHAVAGHGQDQIVITGVAMWTPFFGETWVQYYQDLLATFHVGEIGGIAMHVYTHGYDLNMVDHDYVRADQDARLQGGIHEYRDYLNATPTWARNLPVYITETDQDMAWNDVNNGWVQRLYADINSWNAGADHQKIQAAALYRWTSFSPTPGTFELHQLKDQGGVKSDFATAAGNNYPSPAPSQPLEPTGNECSLEPQFGSQSQNGFTISGWINNYWNTRGGLGVFGLPWTNARKLVNSSGSFVCSQLFERARIEIQLDNSGNVIMSGSTAFITLGRLGFERMPRDQDMINANPLGYDHAGGNTTSCQTFPGVAGVTQICGQIKDYWNSHGGLGIFGYPLTNMFRYTNDAGTSYDAQYFERARLEVHPEDGTIKGGLLGTELRAGVRL